MLQIVFSIAILIMSVVIHEVSHGWVAYALGDPTAKYEGRLTLNPLKHLDPVGSVLVPLITSQLGFTFGWAKPVPYNPYNLRGGKWGPALVGAAGPVSNLALALIFGLLMRAAPASMVLPLGGEIVIVNLVLAVFNLVPVPPLDGSKVLFALLPYRYRHIEEWMNRWQFLLLIIVIFYLWRFVAPLVFMLFTLITGIA